MSEQAVYVHIPLSDDEFGTFEEREAVYALEDQLSAAIAASDAGELDGDEFGGGRGVIFVYGPDADALYTAIEPALRASTIAKGGFAIKCYQPDDPNSAEVRIDWNGGRA